MNKFIKKELNKVNVALPPWDDNTTTLVIHPGGRKVVVTDEFVVGNNLKLHLENYLVHPYEGFTLAENWNGGTNPPESVINATIIQIMGKMIKVDCVGETSGTHWIGWLPKKGIKVVE